MDLLLLAQDVTWGGRAGDAVHLRELARHLSLRGHKVRVVARPSADGTFDLPDVEVHPVRSSFDLAFAPIRKPAVIRALFRAVGARRPDVVYSRSFGDLGEALATAAAGLPLVYEVNGDALAEREVQLGRPLPAPVRAWAMRAARLAFRRARSVVVVTEVLRNRLAANFDVPRESIQVVPNAADTKVFTPRPVAEARSMLNIPLDRAVVGFVGNLAPWQGVEVLVRAFARLQSRNAFLLIVGGGQAQGVLEATVKELAVGDRVRFVGTVPHAQVPAYVAACDVCTAPMTRERLKSGSSAIKIYEYLACERPVVASRIPGLEFLESDDLGRLVPPEDVEALSAALRAALEDEVWRQAAGRRGRAYVLRHAGWPTVAAAVEDVCRRAVSA